MSKKQAFIDYVEENLMSINYESIPENVKIYWESLKKKEEKPNKNLIQKEEELKEIKNY